MTGRKSNKDKKKPKGPKNTAQYNNNPNSPDNDLSLGGPNIKREQPPSQNVVKKIAKAENDEAKKLQVVFKSNPDSQMKDFIKKASTSNKNSPQARHTLKTPADQHPPAVAQELLETDDDVADNLGRLFKASKSFKSV